MEFGGDGDGGDGGDDGDNTSWWMRSDGGGYELCDFFVFSHLSDGMGAFTIYIGFDEAKPTPSRTASWYGLETVLGGH